MAANQSLIDKINALPSERLGDVEVFVDSLKLCEADRQHVHMSAHASESSFKAVWDNDADAAYDLL